MALSSSKSKKIFVALSMCMTLNFTTSALAASVDSLKDKKKSTNVQMNEKKKEINEKKKETKNVSRQIEELDKQLDQATKELTVVQSEIKRLEGNITRAQEELVEAENNINEKQDLFNDRLRVMYKTGDAGYLEILLTSNNIREFFTRKEMIKSVANQDVELLKYMKEQRDLIETKKVELEKNKKDVEVSRNKLEDRRKTLDKATRAKEDLMVQLEADVKSLETEYDKLNDYAKKIEEDIRKLMVNTGSYTGGVMQWPVSGYSRISSPFGYRIHPVFKTKKLHTGIDIPAPTGTAISAAAEGTVIHAGSLGGYGKAVMIDHGGGIVTLYAHNSSLLVSKGQSVQRGMQISKAGSTGVSTGPHLHFEVRKNGSYVDPLPWVKGK